MGWKKNKLLSNGVVAQHWVTSAIHVDVKSKMIRFEYLGYLDEDSMNLNRDALAFKTKVFDIDFHADAPNLLKKLITLLEAETSNEPV